MPVKLMDFGSVYLNGDIYTVGGFGGMFKEKPGCYRYSIKYDIW